MGLECEKIQAAMAQDNTSHSQREDKLKGYVRPLSLPFTAVLKNPIIIDFLKIFNYLCIGLFCVGMMTTLPTEENIAHVLVNYVVLAI